MSTDKLWTVISGIEYQLNILKDKLKNLDEETKQSVDEAYQRGLKDGKEYREKGCEGCKWEDKEYNICTTCRNSYKNLYECKDADGEIKVGDEVIDEYDEKFWVTKIHNGIAEGIMANGEVTCTYLNIIERTGRHIDIEKILDGMKE